MQATTDAGERLKQITQLPIYPYENSWLLGQPFYQLAGYPLYANATFRAAPLSTRAELAIKMH